MRQRGRKEEIFGLIGFEIFIKTACLSVCLPVLRELLKLCIKAAGYSYVTKENLLPFLLSPMSLLCIVFALAAAAVFFLFEMNAVNLALRQKRAGIKVTFSGLFYGGIKKTRLLFRKKLQGALTAFLVLLFVVFISLPVVFFLFLGIEQTRGAVNMAMRPPGLFILLAIVMIVWGFALLGCFFVLLSETENGNMQKLLKMGIGKVRQFRGRIFAGLLKRSAILFVLEFALYFAGLVLMVAVVLRMTPETDFAVILMRTFARYHFIICICFASVNAVIYEYFCASLYFCQEDREAELPPVEKNIYTKACTLKKVRMRKKMLFFAVAAVFVLAAAEMAAFFRNGNLFLSEALEKVCITAHRGASDSAPENTAAAVRQAIEEAADYVELDVRLTADGVAVLLHDAALFRTTRVSKYIREVTYAEASEYDAGSSYSENFAGEKIPSLEEIFECCGGEIGFNIELKTSDDRALAETVVELVERYHLEESCIITSSFYQQLVWVKELNEELKTGYILSFVYGDFYKSEAADFFSIRSAFITEDIVKKTHSVGKEIHAWTVNRENELKRMKAIGVDNIITDKPAYAREVIYGGALAETIEEWILLLTLKK